MDTRIEEPHVDITIRDSVIDWLEWNDRNGCYSDIDRAIENFPPLSLESALNLYFDQSQG